MSITIKQAFQKLAMVTGAALKNPWFIGRNLNQAFADIADNIVDEGGDKVTVTQTLTEGTEIGSIKVNNDTTVLYAPAGGGGGSSAWTLAGSGTGTGSSARIELPVANEYLFVGYYSSTYYSILVHPSELISGAIFRTGFYADSSYNGGVAFSYDSDTNKIRLGTFKQNGSDVVGSATIYVYYR